tara:strand:+ start:1680 stop:2540 length:861 start_codon:yes stop_codon:yes gene_type:complete
MKIFITGATGFIGSALVKKLKLKKWELLCIARNIEQTKLKTNNNIKFISFDIYSDKENLFRKYGVPDILIHLAWSGLPNYQENFHIKKNLPNEKKFLFNAIDSGVKRIIVSGTCFEYGKQEGCLSEDSKTNPNTKYALAKDLLRKKLIQKQKKKYFILQWVRLFYIFGTNQNPKSLFPSLRQSINKKEKFFNIAKGKILRDFLSISEVAKYFVHLCLNPNLNGIINCCSGNPLTIRKFVKKYANKRKSQIKIKTGKFQKPKFEAQNFWGSTTKMQSLSFKFKNKFF